MTTLGFNLVSPKAVGHQQGRGREPSHHARQVISTLLEAAPSRPAAGTVAALAHRIAVVACRVESFGWCNDLLHAVALQAGPAAAAWPDSAQAPERSRAPAPRPAWHLLHRFAHLLLQSRACSAPSSTMRRGKSHAGRAGAAGAPLRPHRRLRPARRPLLARTGAPASPRRVGCATASPHCMQ